MYERLEKKVGEAWANALEAIGIFLLFAIVLLISALALSIEHPSPQLFRDLTQVGAALFVAYAISIAAIRPMPEEKEDEHLSFLWALICIGFCGLVALGLGIALAAYREAGHESILDIAGLCWMIAALFLLGCCVAVYPIVVALGHNPSAR